MRELEKPNCEKIATKAKETVIISNTPNSEGLKKIAYKGTTIIDIDLAMNSEAEYKEIELKKTLEALNSSMLFIQMVIKQRFFGL